MKITSRGDWKATPWRGRPYSVPMSERTHFLVHYWGSGSPRNKSGAALAREVEAVHLNNGWSGVGYSFLVGQDGGILEGRGWGLVGAHCPGKNRTGIGVFVAVGGDDEPSDAAKASVVWLYAEARRRAGHSLTLGVHGDYYATECAGRVLTPWVHAGMPLPDRAGGAQSIPGSRPTSKPAPSKVAKAKAPAFPLPRGHWYGVESNDPRNHSGYWAKDRAGIKAWQAQMKKRGWTIGVDGRFGKQSEKVALAFQADKRLSRDGAVGASTWSAAFTEPVT